MVIIDDRKWQDSSLSDLQQTGLIKTSCFCPSSAPVNAAIIAFFPGKDKKSFNCSDLILPGMTSKRNFPPSSPLVGCSETLFPGKKMVPCGETKTDSSEEQRESFNLFSFFCSPLATAALSTTKALNMLPGRGGGAQVSADGLRMMELSCYEMWHGSSIIEDHHHSVYNDTSSV